jgi:glutaminase
MFQVTKLYNDVLTDPDVVANPGEVNLVSCSSLSRVCAAPAVAICSFTAPQVAGYIPQLANTPHKEAWGVAICSVDGQRFSIGDADTRFCVQSSSKPVTYCIGVRDHGSEYVHSHVGCEPSGVPFNEIVLNRR